MEALLLGAMLLMTLYGHDGGLSLLSSEAHISLYLIILRFSG